MSDEDRKWESAFLREVSLDARTAAEQLRGSSASQVARRAYARAVFATIEGITNHLKGLALESAARTPSRFTAAEIAMLREESYGLNSKGEAYVQPRFVRLEDNLVFALRMYLRDTPVSAEIDRSGKGWQSFRDAIEIRNRVTHPRTIDDLKISDEEIETLNGAERWFHYTVIQNLLEAAMRLREIAAESSDA